jgi:uncharacterized protein
MIRFIILFVVGYLFYRAVKTWMYPKTKTSRTVSGKTVGAIDDIMVKDPFCETYFAKSKGVYLNLDGKDLYFCSTQCKDNYIAANSAKKD